MVASVFLTLIAFFEHDVERLRKERFILLTQVVLVREIEYRVERLRLQRGLIDLLKREFHRREFANRADAFEHEIAFVVARRKRERRLQIVQLLSARHIDSVLVVR